MNFKKLCFLNMQRLTNFPYIEADFDALTNYELLCKVVEYLNNVIKSQNTTIDNVESLYNAFTTLKNYVDNYFENLDVQEEINKKLDEMAESGVLTNLIKNYVNPIFNELENDVNNQIQAQNNNISNFRLELDEMNAKVESAVDNNPIPVSSINDMTDTDRIYVLTTDGYWYYYNGTNWVQGGIYQSSVENYDTTLTQNNAVPNSKSIGDKLNNIVTRKNHLVLSESITGKKYDSTGALVDDTRFLISNIIKLNLNDTLYVEYFIDENTPRNVDMTNIIKVDAYGNFISLITPTNAKLWKADEDCFVKVQFQKSYSYIENVNNLAIAINTPMNRLSTTDYNLVENNNEIDQISKYKNLFNTNDWSHATINNSGVIQNNANYFVTSLIPCKANDVFYLKTFDSSVDLLNITNVIKYDSLGHFIEREDISGLSYTCSHSGYVKFNVRTNSDPSTSMITLSVNEQLSEYIPYKRVITDIESESNIKITKVDNNNYNIKFGNFSVKLFKNVNTSTNSNNWNLKEIGDLYDNIIVPSGTDIIGPIKINDNDDFIGGVHGDEETTSIKLAINNQLYDLANVEEVSGENAKLFMISTVFDEFTKVATFERYVTIFFDNNKIHVSNSYKALANCTLKRATNGGLIACRNNIIDSIIFNNAFYNTPPTTQQEIASHENTTATINTIYGSITVNNIKGYENSNYSGRLYVFTSENPIRCKIYFDTFKNGSYPISTGDVINGEFEYIMS